jgi:aminoglycoside phosphotransferase (APT) family kinase protein
VRRVALPSTWYRTERVEVSFRAEGSLSFFVKDFGSYPRAKDEMEARRERERYLYEEVFGREAVDTPRFAAAVWDAQTTWLVLEYVDAVPLAWCDLDPWFDAAACLGRLQSAIAGRRDELRASGRLRRHDAAHFGAVAERALDAAQRHGPEIAARVSAALPHHRAATAALREHPQTLVHGAYRPEQILIDQRRQPARVYATDWEVAGFGSCLYDLAMLADGFDERGAERLWQRFLAEAEWLRPGPPQRTDFDLARDACRVHRTLNWIAGSHERGIPEATVRALADALG